MFIETKKIDSIVFSLLNPEELKRKGVVKITTQDLFNKNGDPVPNGLFDPRLGPINKYSRCKTCFNDYETCPGHFGYIEFNTKVIFIHLINFIKKTLNCVCNHCSYFLPGENEKLKEITMNKRSDKRLTTVYKFIEGNKNDYSSCPRCEKEHAKVYKDKVKFYTKKNNIKNEYNTEDIYNILKNIDSKYLKYMGFDEEYSRPEWMICTIFPVIPPCARPSVSFGVSNMRSEDDLTFKLIEIIRANNSLGIKKKEITKVLKTNDKEKIEKLQNIYEKQINYTEYHVYTYFDNNLTSMPTFCHKSSRPLITTKERIIGKEGLIRQNLTGKRVNYSARSVVSPEPLIDIDELGVPMKICMKMTYPETVNRFNIDKLYEYVKNGPKVYPGARYIIKKNGTKKDLSFVNFETIKLEYGDIIERHLLAGDYVLFNRQPSLHKFSMMGHRVKPLEGNSFRLNPNVANPYNADFDGDEMNMHVPRSKHTEIELKEIGSLARNIVSPQSNKPIIGFIMDTTLGSARLTNKNKYLNLVEMQTIVSSIDLDTVHIPKPVKYDKYNNPLWLGRDLYSLILPKINYKISGKTEDVIVDNGKIVSGVFDKKVVGATGGGLIHVICNDINEDAAKDFMGNAQRMLNKWLKQEGFSVGFSDIIINDKQQKDIEKILRSADKAVNRYIECHINENKKISKDDFEKKIFGLLNKARDEAGSVAMNSLTDENCLYAMVNSGSKGNFINISQIASCVGQQNIQTGIKQGRIPFSYQNRTLPHFQKYDVSAKARGFVKNSYLNGLTPTEFFFHTQSGREGLIDTAVKTAETGYIQRKLMKAMEDCKVTYDMTVRNEMNNLIEFCYGVDGMDAKYIEKQTFELVEFNNKDFENEYKWNKSFENKEVEKYLKKEYKYLTSMRKHYRDLEYYKKDLYAPININRIIKQSKMESDISHKEELTIGYYIEKMEELMKNIYLLDDNNKIIKSIMENGIQIIRTIIKSKLSSKQSIQKIKLKKEEYDWIIERIYIKFYQAVIHPGENVGAVAAQSLSEPTTQLSVDYDTSVVIKENETLKVVKIGEYIDKIMDINDYKEIKLDICEEGESSVININNDDIQVPSIDQNGKIEWKPLTQISRHPPNGDMVKITTESGKEIISTLSHTFLHYGKTEKIEPIRGSDLKEGMKLPINNQKLLMNETNMINKRIDEVLKSHYNMTEEEREKLDMIIEYVSHTGKIHLLDLV